MGNGQHAIAAIEIDHIPKGSRLPVLGLLISRVQLQQRNYEPAMELSDGILATVEAGSQESDFALLNLMTLHFQAGSAERSRSLATRLQQTTSNEQLRLIAEGTALMLGAGQSGSLATFSTHLRLMAEQQRGVYPHYFGVTMLNLAVNQTLQDDPRSAIQSSNEAIEALDGTSSRLELSAALVARAVALTLIGELEESHATVERASGVDEIETLLERADLLDSFDKTGSGEVDLDSLAERSEANARLLFNLQCAWFYARRGRDQEARVFVHSQESQDVFLFPGQATLYLVTEAYVAAASQSPIAEMLCDRAYSAAKYKAQLPGCVLPNFCGLSARVRPSSVRQSNPSEWHPLGM